MHVALAALPGRDVVFEIGVMTGGGGDVLNGGFRERRAAQIGVQDDASRIDDAAQRRRQRERNGGLDFIFQRGGARGFESLRERGASRASCLRMIEVTNARPAMAISASIFGRVRSSSTEGIWRSAARSGVVDLGGISRLLEHRDARGCNWTATGKAERRIPQRRTGRSHMGRACGLRHVG